MNDEQKRLAQASKEKLEKDGKTVETAIEPLTTFTRAEQYHQKYTLRANNAFVKELKRCYADERDLENSTSAARLNGYLAGDGKASLFEEEIGKLGLSPDHQKLLRERVKGRLQKDDEVAPAECGAGAEESPAGKK